MKAKSFAVLIVLCLSIVGTFSAPPLAHAVPPTNSVFTGFTNASTAPMTLTVANTGDLIVVNVQIVDGQAADTAVIVDHMSDSFGSVFSFVVSHERTTGSCSILACLDSEIWAASATGSGADVITTDFNDTLVQGNLQGVDVVGVSVTTTGTATGSCPSGCSMSMATMTGALTFTSADYADASLWTGCQAAAVLTPGTGLGVIGSGSPFDGVAMYTTALSTNPTVFPASCSVASPWIDVGAVFGPAPTGKFTCSITNMDGGNYLIANNQKFYKFLCEVQSSGISGFLSYPISDVQIKWNDSVSTVIAEYNNVTGLSQLDSGTNIAIMGTPLISQGYHSGVRTMNITFPITLTANAIDSFNRGIQLYAQMGGNTSRGFTAVRSNYFNIYNKGGGVTQKINGLCSVPLGADTYQTICQYQATPSSWIAENSTWYHLQQFQGLFSIKLANNYGNPDSTLWMNYANSGSGAQNSSNPGDWKIDVGFYTWDNSSVSCCWVKTIHATISMLAGRQGANNEWTEFKVGWFDGSRLIQNQTFFAYIEQNPLSQVTIWANMWYSQNNNSMSLGGRIGAYYTGMHNSGYLWWSSWSPFLQNDSASQVFMPLEDHTGKTMSSQLAQFTRVYMNMSRPGAPAQHTGQVNFQVLTRSFQIESFGIAASSMGGVDTPAFTAAVVPIIQNTGFFSPIIKALQSLATLIGNAFLYIGTQLWASLGSRFPWFTGTLAWFGSFILAGANILGTVIVYVVDFLQFMYSVVGLITYPITAIINGYGIIRSMYLPVFGGANLQAIIIIAVLWIFAGYIIDNAERGDTKGFINLATGAWRVVNTIAYWTYLIAKFFIDAAEGLIP